MTDAANNTKVERVVEAVEDFANAIIEARGLAAGSNRFAVKRVTTAVLDARKDLADTLREFLKPAFRVIDGDRQRYPDGTTTDEKPKCAACGLNVCCIKPNCPDWHAAIRVAVQAPPGAA